ncbi:metallophosphoesterase family protein [Fluviibacterium sp. DFM31]|uniref:Metallophosphoesterase family protein n=1 Tax=Meridianimarinicoccus marinus TaxID=3231483 RepID=A0ABV3L7X4_9RHOB
MAAPIDRLRRGLAALRPGAERQFTGASAPTPARPAYVVGDVHGCANLLATLLTAIEDDRTARGWSDTDLVLVGDYVDRGPDSRDVLADLRARQSQAPDRVHCLCGNHEAMMLDFLTDPVSAGPTWLNNGGRETLLSFGVTVARRLPDLEALVELAVAARAAIPATVTDWVRGLPLLWRSGDLVAVHAGLHPDRTPEDQAEVDMLWEPPLFRQAARQDGLWVVHGHRITVPPVAEAGRISVDTGAFAYGVLSCAVLAPGEAPRFLQAKA